ncbi:MAG: hypothetical protein KDA44_01295 [Planctomycetales bacterium]|nr:hypothetical protein [Planctomycetales bacterium]
MKKTQRPGSRSRGVSGRELRLEQLESRCLLAVDVLTWHNDVSQQGLNADETMLTPANVNTSTFGKLFTYAVQGQVYAQPLYVSDLVIPGQGTHNVVFVATQNNDVYAFDADSNSGPSGGLLWHVNLGLAADLPNDYFGNRYGPYHDINPQVGITGTPVIDLATNTMYVDAFTHDNPTQNAYSHHIWALDLTTGSEKTAPALVAAAVQGDGADSVGGTITFSATQQLQRPALRLLEGTLYVAYAGFADTDPYHGWVLGFNPSTLQLTKAYTTTPNAGSDTYEGEGGIWQTGAGLASDGTRLYLMVGNGDFNAAVGDFGDSFLELTPDGSAQPANKNGYGISTTDYFTPYNEQQLADADADLGSGGTLLLPDQAGAHPHLLVGAGKQGIIYVIDRDDMGQFNAGFDDVVQKVSLGHNVFSSPAYFNNRIYYHAVNDVLKAFSVTDGVLSAAPVAQAGVNYGYPGATPSISANGTANGIVWEVQYDSSHAVLRANDATTLAELYTSNQNAARDQLGGGVKFVTPTIADGRVFVGASGELGVFGLIAPPTAPPDAPTGLAATAVNASQIQLSWIDNSDNEGGFKVERSTDNVNFVQIGVASAASTSYVDGTVSQLTTYYYRVRATNVIGDSAYTNTASATTPGLTIPTDLYHFDEGSGASTADSVGTKTGTLVGNTPPAWAAPKIGDSALSFSGDGAFRSTTPQSAVQVPSNNNLTSVLGGTATLTAWIKTTQTGGTELWNSPAITGVEVAGSSNDIRWGYLDQAGHIGIGAGNAGVVSATAINDGQWHHVAFTRDEASGAVKIYVDGILQASGQSDTGIKSAAFRLIGAQTDLTGSGAADGATYFNGQLDEVRIYDQILGDNEIAGMAIAPVAPTLVSATKEPGPVVHLTFSSASPYAQEIEVYRKTGVGGTYAKIDTLPASATLYDDTAVTLGEQYYYQLQATDLAGPSPASNELNVTVQFPSVVSTQVFYNNSYYDGQNGSSNGTDTLAAATDKQPLLPGQTATFANYTSYEKGLNGVFINVANLEVLPRVDDLEFRVGNDDDPTGWAQAPTPTFLNTYPGRGPGGSTQIAVVWADNAIRNEWLQVTLIAQPHLQLTEDHVFYFGNFIGDSGAGGNTAVDSADELATRSNLTAPGGAGIANVFDFNRDKQVDSQDVLIARSHRSGLSPLKLITAPAAPIAVAASVAPIASPLPAFEPASALTIDSSPVDLTVPTSTDATPSFQSSWIVALELAPPSNAAREQAIDQALSDFHAAARPQRSYQSRNSPTLTRDADDEHVPAVTRSHHQTAPAPESESQSRSDSVGESLTSQLRPGKRRFGPLLPALLLIVGFAARASAANIVVGTHLLSANMPNQSISIFVSGGEAIAGEDFFAQIGDGGSFVGGVDVKPSFTSVDIVSGAVFADDNNGAFGDLGPGNAVHPLIWVDGTTTATGTVAADGLLATLTIDTTGLSGSAFPLLLTGVAPSLGGFDTTLRDASGAAIALSIANGLIKIAPGMSADFNENGTVDDVDLGLWSSGFGTAAGAVHLQGDATGEGIVDGADFLVWQRQVSVASATVSAIVAPEPSGQIIATLLWCGGLPFLVSRTVRMRSVACNL